MDKGKIIVSVVIDKLALVDRAFDISKNPSEFNELKKVITAKTSLLVISTRLMMKARRRIIRTFFAGIALDIILSDNQELAIVKRLNLLEDKKSSFLAKMKKLDELQKKVKSGEMPGVEGLRMLLKVIEEGE
mgnify:CR=1 FL=1